MADGGGFKRLRVDEVYEIQDRVNREKDRIFREYGFEVDHYLTYGDIWLVMEELSRFLEEKEGKLSKVYGNH